MQSEDPLKKIADTIRNSATIKVISMGILILLLLIPSSMVSSLVRERELRKESVVREINDKWGGSQVVTGPFVTVPFKSYYKDEDNQLKFTIQYLHLLPETLSIECVIDPQIRYRSIYEAVLYNSKLKISGNFGNLSAVEQSMPDEDILWDRAVISLGISDMKGIKDDIVFIFDGIEYRASPGLITQDVSASGVKAVIAVTEDTSCTFSTELDLDGSEQLHFIPVGESTGVHMVSTWDAPGFNGEFLPAERYVTADGFDARWTVLQFNRNFPQAWIGNRYKVDDSAFGLELVITADLYQKTMRMSKYSLMFIVFTFSAFFCAEIISRKRVHPIQYLMIGLAIVLFYVLLLSISEHINFDISYLVSAIAITILVTLYAKGIGMGRNFSLILAAILAALYTFLYIILQLEGYSLLLGSLALFAILAGVMYLTRKIDWYHLTSDQE